MLRNPTDKKKFSNNLKQIRITFLNKLLEECVPDTFLHKSLRSRIPLHSQKFQYSVSVVYLFIRY